MNLNSFDNLLKCRIRAQATLEIHHKTKEQQNKDTKDTKDTNVLKINRSKHVVGLSDCLDCMKNQRRGNWRDCDINPAVVGPRDAWRLYAWGNAVGMSLMCDNKNYFCDPIIFPSITETITVYDAEKKAHSVGHDAKFTAMASGQYHTLLLSESGSVYACGDNKYGALGIPLGNAQVLNPWKVEFISDRQNFWVEMIATTSFASFALVAFQSSDEQGRQHSIRNLNYVKTDDRTADVYNYLYAWGRGKTGVLGTGNNDNISSPQIIPFFNKMRILQVSTGHQHVLVLTECDGLYAFGDGSKGQLGVGDRENHPVPKRVSSFDHFHVAWITAGDNHSVALTGETSSLRQAFSWGLGDDGRLGHGDEFERLLPTCINYFRGKSILKVMSGGSHNLALTKVDTQIYVWSWGLNTYGQLGLGHTWSANVPNILSMLTKEHVTDISVGRRHSLAKNDNGDIWIWGQGYHGQYSTRDSQNSMASVLHPVKMDLPEIHVISGIAGKDCTFVWGDRAANVNLKQKSFGGVPAHTLCSASPNYETLISDSLRVLYNCKPCGLNIVCIACAHHCHVQHSIQLQWTFKDTLNRNCDCYNSPDCLFCVATEVN